MNEPVRLGKYVLLERVAIGGMAEVFRAAIYGVGGFSKELIIKRILPDIAEEETFVRMFIDEARLASQLQHPNIVQVFDFDCIDGAHFIAMEYVRGRDLGYVLKRARERGTKLPEGAALFIFSQLLEALRYAHEKTDAIGQSLDIVHRDVSPQNVLLSFEGEVKLADFGIAKAAGTSRTAAGSLKGKYRYMAPEYVRKQHVDQRSDVYAAGAVLFELLTNESAFREANEMALLTDIAQGNFRRPREVDPTIPPSLASLIETAMALEPEQRFPSARAFLDALKETCRVRNVELTAEPLRRYLAENLSVEIESSPAVEVPTAAMKTVASGDGATRLLAREPPPPPRRGWRAALFMAVALAAGITAHRMATPPPRVGVMMRMMATQEDWVVKEVFQPFAQSSGVEVPIARYRSVQDVEDAVRADGTVSLVKVEQVMLRPMVEADLIVPIDIYLKDRGRTAELDEILGAFHPIALDLAMVPDHVALRLYGLPRKLETAVLIYRRSKVEEAAARWSEHLPLLEDELVRLVGHGLPRGFRLETDPAEWDFYDVLVAGWYWSRTEPRLMQRSYAYNGTFHTLYDQLSALSNDSSPAIAVSESMIDLFEWEALFRELGLYREKMFVKEEVITGRVVQEAVSRGEVYLTRMHSLGIALLYEEASEEVKKDLVASVLPLGVSLQLDSEGNPVRIGSRRGTVNAWHWALPKNAPHPEEGYRLARHLTSREVLEREAKAFLIQPPRGDVPLPRGPLADAVLPAVAEQMKLNGSHRLPAAANRRQLDVMVGAMIDAWWRIVAERGALEGRRIDRRKIGRELQEVFD